MPTAATARRGEGKKGPRSLTLAGDGDDNTAQRNRRPKTDWHSVRGKHHFTGQRNVAAALLRLENSRVPNDMVRADRTSRAAGAVIRPHDKLVYGSKTRSAHESPA